MRLKKLPIIVWLSSCFMLKIAASCEAYLEGISSCSYWYLLSDIFCSAFLTVDMGSEFFLLQPLTSFFLCPLYALNCRYGRLLYVFSVYALHGDGYVAMLSVCPFVCPSHAGIRWKRLIVFTVHSPIILVLSASNTFTKFRRGHPLRGAKYRWGVNFFVIFDQ